MIDIIQECLNCYMNGFALLYCINYSMKKKLHGFKFILTSFVIGFLMYVISNGANVGNLRFFMANFLMPLLFYFIFSHIYQDRGLYILYYCLLFNVILGVSILFFSIFFSYLSQHTLFSVKEIGFFFTLIPLLASVLSVLLFRIIIKYDQIINENIPHNMSVRFVVMNLISTLLLTCLFELTYNLSQHMIIYIILGLFIAQFVLQNFIFVQLSILYQKNSKLELTELSNNINVKYIKDLELEQQKMREFKHDIKNHLMILKDIKIKENAMKYMDQIEKELDSSAKLVNTGNFYIDACLNTKIQTFQNIEFEINGAVKNELTMDEKDICSLLFNLIDNAAEAAGKCENPKVQIKIMSNENALLIYIANSCIEEPELKTKKGYEHGYGIGIINNIIEKYEGDILFSYDKNMFRVKININL